MELKTIGGGRPPRPGRLGIAALAAVTALGGILPATAARAEEGAGDTDVTVQVADTGGNIAWSAPTQVPFRATAAGTLVGPTADAVAIRNLSSFAIRVKEMDASAQDPFHLVDDVDESTGDNDFQMTWNGVKAKSQVELADDGTWAMGYAGNRDGTDVLPLTYSDSKIARVTADLSKAQKAATISWTVEPTVKDVRQDPKPDPNGVAFAVYSADDQSLDLYKRDRKPEVGDTFNGKIVTAIENVDENKVSYGLSSPIDASGTQARAVEVVDNGIKPAATRNWFFNFRKATTADIVKLDTSNVTDMDSMFYGCYNLVTAGDLSCWDTSKVTNMFGIFSWCSSLSSLELSGWDTSNVTNMSSMFYSCYNLTSLDLSGWDTSNVTDMSSMFRMDSGEEHKLTSLDLTNWDTSKVTSMSFMFAGCDNLIAVAGLFDWNVSNVTDMSYMFNNCGNLTSLDLSGWDTSNVTDMQGLFSGCESLATVGDLSGWDTSKVTSMDGMFFYCSKLTSLNLSNWNVSNVRNFYNDTDFEWGHSGMFQYCNRLTTVGDLSNWNVSNAVNMREMFRGCKSLATVGDLSGWDVSKVTDMDGMFYESGVANPPSWYKA